MRSQCPDTLSNLQAFGIFACFLVVYTSHQVHNDDISDHPLKKKQQLNALKRLDESQNASKTSQSNTESTQNTNPSGDASQKQESSSESSGQESSAENTAFSSEHYDHRKDAKDVYPFYKLSINDGGQPWKWPGVGWDTLSLDDKRFTDSFRFYIQEDGVFNMTLAEQCFRRNMKIFDANDRDHPHLLDEKLRLNQRQYLVELYLWPELHRHHMRTMDPEAASMFFIGYSPYLNHQSYPCNGVMKTRAWEEALAEAIKENKYWKRHGGKDHFLIYMKYNIMLPRQLQNVLDSGVNVITTDRHYWSISHNLKNTFEAGRVIVIPYVCSTFMDSQFIEYTPEKIKNPKSHYMFFGNLRRRFGGRSYILDLGEMLEGANFRGTELHREPIPGVLNETGMVMRQSSVCLCPSGDAPTSVRVFEALGSGCIPVVLGYKDKLHTDLPYPSLIDWDAVAFFTLSLETITKRPDGLKVLAKALEDTVGPHVSPEKKARLDKMRAEGTRVFNQHLAYRKNPRGAVDSLLLEAWVLLQKHGILSGPYTQPAKKKGRKKD